MAYTPQTWQDLPSTSSPIDAARLNYMETGIQSGNTTVMTPTAVKTGSYNAVAGDYVPVDTTSGSVTITLPSAPANLTRVGVKMVIQGSTNTVTINRSGSDVFNKVGGSTSLTLTLLNQAITLQYASGLWYVVSDDLALSQLDTRYGTGTSGTVTNGVLLWNGSAWVNSLIGASSWNSASSIPITGTHTQGEIVLNSAPTAGGFIGWVCVSSGTPGTWKTWGVISA